ncbi:hypothetical protein ACX84Q_13325, partial [Burkholderia pseudomallei]
MLLEPEYEGKSSIGGRMADAAASTSRDARGDRHRRCPTAGQGARPPRGARVRAKKTPAVGDGGRFVAS